MKILLVYPDYPETFWSFKYALKFVFKKASNPPLGLLTIASLLPRDWEVKLIDMNVEKLKDRHITWADYVFISAMSVQRASVHKIIQRCRSLDRKIVAGGPLFTTDFEEFPGVDHFVLNEGEITLPQFLEDLKNGEPKKIYQSTDWAELNESPVPRWELLKTRKYASLCIQYSRGCPFNCEFCDITLLFGRKVRTKTINQLLNELENIYQINWKGAVFFVDDNFIGNKKILKEEVLPEIIAWQKKHNYPFSFITQCSIDLSDDKELLDKMRLAGFDTVFIGIETVNEDSLAECNKYQNKNRDMVECVKKIQQAGLQVQGGFIVGFDNDPFSIFETQIKFIQKSGIVTAMVGLLHVLPRTKLYWRLKKENRILSSGSGNNTDSSLNFIPKMEEHKLLDGYKKIVKTLYSPKVYYTRVITFLKEYQPFVTKGSKLTFRDMYAFFRSIVLIGINGKEWFHYWRLVLWTSLNKPKLFPLAITLAIYGFHFRKVFEKI